MTRNAFVVFLIIAISSDVVGFLHQEAECVTCCLLFKFCMASPGLPCPRPCPVRLLLARGSFRLGEGRNGDGEASSDKTPSWTEMMKIQTELVTKHHNYTWNTAAVGFSFQNGTQIPL